MTDELAVRLLARMRAEIIELDEHFGIDGDLFAAGLDSMGIMQLTLLLEDEFGSTLPDRLIRRDTFASARQIAEAIREARGE